MYTYTLTKNNVIKQVYSYAEAEALLAQGFTLTATTPGAPVPPPSGGGGITAESDPHFHAEKHLFALKTDLDGITAPARDFTTNPIETAELETGAVTDTIIGMRVLTDEAAENQLVPVNPKNLTTWLQRIRNNLKHLYAADAASDTELTAIESRLDGIETALANLAPGADLSGIEKRLDDIETALAGIAGVPPADLSAIESRLDAIDAAIAGIEGAGSSVRYIPAINSNPNNHTTLLAFLQELVTAKMSPWTTAFTQIIGGVVTQFTDIPPVTNRVSVKIAAQGFNTAGDNVFIEMTVIQGAAPRTYLRSIATDQPDWRWQSEWIESATNNNALFFYGLIQNQDYIDLSQIVQAILQNTTNYAQRKVIFTQNAFLNNALPSDFPFTQNDAYWVTIERNSGSARVSVTPASSSVSINTQSALRTINLSTGEWNNNWSYGGNMYDTNERLVGTWIDGKPIYRRVFTGNTGTAGSVTIAAAYIDRLIDVKGSCNYQSSGVQVPFGFIDSLASLTCHKSAGNLVIQYGGGTSGNTTNAFNNQQYELAVEYTKAD